MLRAINHEHHKSPISAVLIQEHNLRAKNGPQYEAHARRSRILVLFSYVPEADGPDARGGTLIAIPYDSIELSQGETRDDAIDRIKTSVRESARTGRVISAEISIEGHHIRAVSCYAYCTPSRLRPPFFEKVLSRFVNKHTVLGIDANCVPDVMLDVKRALSATAYDNLGAAELTALVLKCGLADIARETLGSDPFFTSHHSTANGICHTRIDQIYTPNLNAQIWSHGSCHDFFPAPLHLPGVAGLDHVAVQASLTVAKGERGKALRTIKDKIYDNHDFNSTLDAAIKREYAQSRRETGSPGAAWEKAKELIRKLSHAETRRITRVDSRACKLAKIEILELQSKVDDGTADEDTFAALAAAYLAAKEAREENKSLFETTEECAYHMADRHDTGSAAFHRPFKPKSSGTWVDSVFNADWTDPSNPVHDGTHTTEAGAIPKAFTEYYKNLFANKPSDPQAANECLQALERGARVLPPTALKCDAPIDCDKETLPTCAKLPGGKSPGPDRIPNKFYTCFAETIAPMLTDVFNEALDKGALPDSLLEGLISILYKKKARNDPRNYRPIALLNCDYKILMRILTARMAEAVLQFVSACQTGFVPGAFIAENTMLLNLLQAVVDDEDTEALFIFLDMEKAFDRVSWDYLHAALEAIGFGAGFRSWIKLAYSPDHPPSRKIYVNGYLSESFNLFCSTAQGCPLSRLSSFS